jgi:hypothetical protein
MNETLMMSKLKDLKGQIEYELQELFPDTPSATSGCKFQRGTRSRWKRS